MIENIERDSTLQQAMKDDKYGFTTSYDGDNHNIIVGATCSHCGKYFEQYRDVNHIIAELYCPKCINKYKKNKK